MEGCNGGPVFGGVLKGVCGQCLRVRHGALVGGGARVMRGSAQSEAGAGLGGPRGGGRAVVGYRARGRVVSGKSYVVCI